jgi:hypothetical protein
MSMIMQPSAETNDTNWRDSTASTNLGTQPVGSVTKPIKVNTLKIEADKKRMQITRISSRDVAISYLRKTNPSKRVRSKPLVESIAMLTSLMNLPDSSYDKVLFKLSLSIAFYYLRSHSVSGIGFR